MNKTAHEVATWIGVFALLVAVAMPVVHYVTEREVLNIWWAVLLGFIGVLFVGSKRVKSTVTEWIRAWRGNE